ncbi:probable leucine-rich repeat receptor-like serine/threonine-protein kinase At3g14840 [Rosa rugosa]|uniref:probable leucine-rich repeat receptor-like serine/threonine-protein kinase At3g14840 n=1 Tax=Rosa rugosa TaxID=74645 RepID=UPI002B403BB4|nr:probable leucine-rich repeat receptor-like serine/threonine-protein kinase At3g14840 [Rosa rugosa]
MLNVLATGQNMSYTFFFRRLLVYSILLVIFASFALGATRLSDVEVQALKIIGKTLGKDRNFIADPCSSEASRWIDTTSTDSAVTNNVTCGNCSTAGDDQICHVTSISLKAQNLAGTLPPELARLPYLQIIDLTRNYLNGTIPREWGSLPLVNISLVGNRLTDSIPIEIGNISTLQSLDITSNNFSGVLPLELGNLTSIDRMLLSSNNFTGKLPETFARLTTLTDFRVDDNHFSGKIPDFIQKWTNLSKLVIQASGLTGPIPSSISLLKELTDLRITDLDGPHEALFPRLDNMTKLKTLMLRNCNLTGELALHTYLVKLTDLKYLDLSFNKLTGKIPGPFVNKVTCIFLTGNLLNGTVPESLKGTCIDLSYNNMTTGTDNCGRGSMNLFASSSKENKSIISCLHNATCSKELYSLHINCGGDVHEAISTSVTYEADIDQGGPSSFYKSNSNWGFSSTGYYPDDDHPQDTFIVSNKSTLSMLDPQLYMTARVSPISLTYFGFCLRNENYTVKLHFAEIMFTNDTTYRSLGRRIFDIYIQGKQVEKDFNIADAAGGNGISVIKNYTAFVTNQTLEIRFFWNGKGTQAIPERGVYGPLISAISVDPNYIPPPPSPEPSPGGGSGISAAEVVGIVAGGVFIILVILCILWWKGFIGPANTLEQDLKGVDLQTGKFTLRQIKTATNNFDIANKIGEGGFGPVYRGLLSDNTAIAVKKLSAKSKQGNREFVNEIGMISALQHPHLVKLYGCCIEGNNLLLVYEYMENNSLARALFGPKDSQVKLDWPTRHRICVGIARGLAYLHEESRLKIVHRDIKATNVLLDKNLFPKISDFGLAKLDEDDNTHISTRIAGTFGYMAPEYAMRGYLTDKADVYSFGILVLEMVSGRCNTTYRSKEECFYLLDWALLLKERASLLDLVDPRLDSEFNKAEMITTINIALLCANASSAVRPAMSSVVSMLEGKASVQEVVFDPNASINEINAMRKHFQSNIEENNGDPESQRQTMSIEGSWTASSTSAQDLYPVRPDSYYWENRN